MTRTSTHAPPPATWRARLFVLGGLTAAALHTAGALALGADLEHAGPLWLAALAWTVLASLAGALHRGLRHGDWSAFGGHELADDGELVDWTTRTGRYACMRIHEEHLGLTRGS